MKPPNGLRWEAPATTVHSIELLLEALAAMLKMEERYFSHMDFY